MKDNNSEQKSLPASEKKLRDARKKGQVSSSRDLISGFALLAMLAYLQLAWPSIRDHVLELLQLVSGLHREPFGTAWRMALGAAMETMWLTVVPAVAVLIAVTVTAGVIGTFGPVFSFETVKPNFEHINPAAGLQRIFSLRNFVEFVKSILKIVLLGSVLFFVLRIWLQSMLHLPNCGEHCVVPMLIAALKPILAVAAIAFILLGVFDIALQRWLFLRDMRMTRTEAKRERKDIEGDPLILGERKRERQRQNRGPSRLGLSAANIVIAGEGYIAGLRYHRTELPVPVVVIRSRGDTANAIREAAARLDIPVTEDADLAAALANGHRPGDFLRQEHFPVVARILVKQGLT